MNLNELLKIAVAKKASDVHLKASQYPMLRITGRLFPEGQTLLTARDTEEIALSVMSPVQQKKFADRSEIDLAYTPDEKSRFRINVFRQRGTIEIVMRHIPTIIPTVEDLSLPVILKNVALEPRGMILVTGVTGSGKSTTIAAMLGYINEQLPVHVITIEDPIEFYHTDKKSSFSQRELGIDTDSYVGALKYALRQDPDVIFIGEIRDYETVTTALSAAETGHLVFSTLHTIDASQTIDRVIDFFPANQQEQIKAQFSNTVTAIISMRLLERTDGEGLVPAVEVMLGTQTLKTLIREGKTSQIKDAIQAGASHYGMQTFDQSLIALYKKKLITLDAALAEATSPNDVKLALSGIVSSTDAAQSVMQKQ